MEILPVLQVTPIERQLPVVQAFLETDEYQTYLEDAEVCMRIVPHNVVHVTGVKYIAFGITCLSLLWLSICVLAWSAVC